jgi:hypothetical protein
MTDSLNESTIEFYNDDASAASSTSTPTSPPPALSFEALLAAVQGMSSEQKAAFSSALNVVSPPNETSPSPPEPPAVPTPTPPPTTSSKATSYVSAIGGYLQSDKKIAVSGGAPNLNWTKPQALKDDPKSYFHVTPGAYRDPTQKKSAEMYKTTIAYNPKIGKLKHSDAMYRWSKDLMTEHENFGIDSPGWVRPQLPNETRRVSVYEKFKTLDIKQVIKDSKLDTPKWK